MNCDMPPVAMRHHSHEAPAPGSGQPAAGSARFSLLQIDVKVEEPETFVIHNIVWRRTQLLAAII